MIWISSSSPHFIPHFPISNILCELYMFYLHTKFAASTLKSVRYLIILFTPRGAQFAMSVAAPLSCCGWIGFAHAAESERAVNVRRCLQNIFYDGVATLWKYFPWFHSAADQTQWFKVSNECAYVCVCVFWVFKNTREFLVNTFGATRYIKLTKIIRTGIEV